MFFYLKKLFCVFLQNSIKNSLKKTELKVIFSLSYLLFVDNFVKLNDIKEKFSQLNAGGRYADTF